MKYSLLFVVIGSLFCSNLNAQAKISAGFKAGITIPGLGVNSSNPVIDGYKNQLAPYFGFVLETGLNEKWSLLNEINYATISIKKNGSQAIPQSAYASLNLSTVNFPDYLYSNFESKINIKYVEIPIMLKYYVYQNKKMNFFVNGGGFAGILFFSDLKTKGPGYQGQGYIYTDAGHTNSISPFPLKLSQEPSIQDRLNPLNIGLAAGIGCTFIGNAGEFYINADGAFGLINMQLNKGDGENKSEEATLSIGYLLHLSK